MAERKDISVRSALDQIDLSVQHLQAELKRVDVLIRREVRRWQLAGQDPSDDFRGLYLSDAQAEKLLDRPFGTSWGQTVVLEPQEERSFATAYAEATRRAEALAEMARQRGQPTRLERLATIFSLDRFELDAILICLAPALDLGYERIYGYLQDDITRKRPSTNLVLELLCDPGPERLRMLSRFSDSAPLLKYHLLERVLESETAVGPLLSRTLQLETGLVAWLLGEYQPHAELGPYARLLQPDITEEKETEDRLLAAGVWPGLERTIGESFDLERDWPIVVFHGPDRVAQHSTARLIAGYSSSSSPGPRSLLQVDLEAVAVAGGSLRQILRLALRDARLIGAIPYLLGWDACLADGSPQPDLLAELCAYPNLIIVAGRTAWQAQDIDRDRTLLWVEFPVPTYPQRGMLWRHFLEQIQPETCLDVAEPAGQFILTSSQIRDAVATARDRAIQRGDSLQENDLFAAARAHSNPRLASLARKIVPRYTWEDIILPDDQLALLREIVATVRGRPKVLDEWGVGRKLAASDGVTMLFAGPPGTGKTMAAEVIAAELNLDLYKIDLSTIVSKYIGETEKNLERIFAEAQSSSAILFFDEADALFGKRSEVKDSHDRYANIEISYLLQRMEMYDGVTILATNLRANLDEAFTRRLQFAVDFPFPEEAYRLRIWQTLFPPSMPSVPGLDLALLARRFRLTGGNIRNIIVNAAFLAAAEDSSVNMEHLLHATRRELQKMGRLVNEDDLVIEK
jgi:ATP-dependent 26S proteasome regulatory subunit